MPISVTFVLGKKESYFFNTPKHWAWHNLPSDIEALFTQTPAIQDVIELALGNNGTYFVSYRDHGGKILCKHYNLPNALTSWLYCSNAGIIRDLSSLSITLGPYDSYYAWDSSSASWSNLPPKLEKSILNRLETQDVLQTTWKANGAEAPSFVSLGADEAYWMRTVSGGGCWDLKCSVAPTNPGATDGMSGLRGVNKFLEDSSDFMSIACLHLFPSHPNAYILITTGGKAFSNLPEFTWPDYNKIAPAFPSFTQTRSPIPPIPQPPPMRPQLQYTQQSSQQTIPQQRPNCCPNNTHMGQYNCCPQQTTHSAPYRISPAFVNALGAPLAQTGPFNTPTSTQYNVSGSNANMGGPVYR
ncbi:hypothetical protein HBH56_151730 [Parastagonospora nodorum]|uniref:Uncharacterized protein n=1 Tax=Phaeosphaeria nodorum (strain SN15 / ATCC MYA-4574 / FGSC 10173) TaxID=321614 RepID=A0A7U2EZX5_PHANO|nr:hypothetical protein HBH56_151730 [Parastagonospora nodorum]QRC96145.1 hypothetical protein JI435_057810 [Parastagonospora nodorum SN15]KAH3926705.1 hypothetical protein HBH54_165970 [Parastagonospora nodorum]KAH3971913.1 hypothetical protein HBH51_108280 [Parastagonospora nodorum]KAH4029631.1 hypothetical protein HBI09_135830 [Parastagonospora nodorum]